MKKTIRTEPDVQETLKQSLKAILLAVAPAEDVQVKNLNRLN